MLNSTAQHSTAQHSTAQHSTAQHSTAQHSTAQPGPAPENGLRAVLTRPYHLSPSRLLPLFLLAALFHLAMAAVLHYSLPPLAPFPVPAWLTLQPLLLAVLALPLALAALLSHRRRSPALPAALYLAALTANLSYPLFVLQDPWLTMTSLWLLLSLMLLAGLVLIHQVRRAGGGNARPGN